MHNLINSQQAFILSNLQPVLVEVGMVRVLYIAVGHDPRSQVQGHSVVEEGKY